jgi:SSS family solute:Na+ symporter
MYNNAMDIIQLVFAFVNAPLFATFLLGMFWSRTTGTGAFIGLILGTARRALPRAHPLAGQPARHQGRLPGRRAHLPERDGPELLARRHLRLHRLLLATAGISLATARTKTDDELKGLVYSLTPKIKDESLAWYQRPAVLGTVLLAACVVLNLIFW